MDPAATPTDWSATTGQPHAVGSHVTLEEIDALVANAVCFAADQGLIPIAAAISTPQTGDHRHLLHGVGWNRLAEGIPGVHGETGALQNAGRVDFRAAVMTTSLAPCPFCQATMTHLGIRSVRILDATNYVPEVAETGLRSTVAEHPLCVTRFGAWLGGAAQNTLWERDIGVFHGATRPPRTWTPSRIERAVRSAARAATQCAHPDDAPIGAAILDDAGEVLATGCTRIHADDDPTAVAAMVAWRRCGGRAHWRDCTLVLTDGLDRITASLFTLFGFGQLLLCREHPRLRSLAPVLELGIPALVLDQEQSPPPSALANWLPGASAAAVTAALGVEGP